MSIEIIESHPFHSKLAVSRSRPRHCCLLRAALLMKDQDENVAAPPLTPFFEPIAQTASKLTMLVYLQGPQMI